MLNTEKLEKAQADLKERGPVRPDLSLLERPKNLEFAGLASLLCTQCKSTGLRYIGSSFTITYCPCVYRNIFDAALQIYLKHKLLSPYTEYTIDFYLVSLRYLEDPLHRLIFKEYFLEGKQYSDFLHLIDRGNFFHIIYRIKEKLGRVFLILKPYPIFPISSYYAGATSIDYSNIYEEIPMAYRTHINKKTRERLEATAAEVQVAIATVKERSRRRSQKSREWQAREKEGLNPPESRIASYTGKPVTP